MKKFWRALFKSKDVDKLDALKAQNDKLRAELDAAREKLLRDLVEAQKSNHEAEQ
jgi:hypothetical protein